MVTIKLKVLGKIPSKLFNQIRLKHTDKISTSDIGLFVDYSKFYIPKNTRTTSLSFHYKKLRFHGKISFINDNAIFDIKILERGFKSICFIRLNDSNDLQFLKRIPEVSGWFSNNKADHIWMHLDLDWEVTNTVPNYE